MLDGVPVLPAALTLAMVLMTVAGVRSCGIVTRAGNARSFPLRSQDIIIMAAAEAYAGFRVGEEGERHASLYPPLRRRTILHDLSKL
jgi:hypothetical protein